jgi:hypothetical protein
VLLASELYPEQRQTLDFVLTETLDMATTQGAISLHKRSEGQRSRCDLALFLTLHELAQQRSHFQFGCLFIDELYDKVDLHGKQAILRWAEKRVTALLQHVFVFTQDDAHAMLAHDKYALIEVTWHTRLGSLYRTVGILSSASGVIDQHASVVHQRQLQGAATDEKQQDALLRKRSHSQLDSASAE